MSIISQWAINQLISIAELNGKRESLPLDFIELNIQFSIAVLDHSNKFMISNIQLNEF